MQSSTATATLATSEPTAPASPEPATAEVSNGWMQVALAPAHAWHPDAQCQASRAQAACMVELLL